MKKSVFILLAVICLSSACKKEPGMAGVEFIGSFAHQADSIYSDSVAYVIINYSDESEIKDTAQLYDLDIFSKSIKQKITEAQKRGSAIRMDYINIADGHRYVLKKLDFISESGTVIYHIPYGKQSYQIETGDQTIDVLPLLFSVIGPKMSLVLTIIKK